MSRRLSPGELSPDQLRRAVLQVDALIVDVGGGAFVRARDLVAHMGEAPAACGHGALGLPTLDQAGQPVLDQQGVPVLERR